MDHMEPVAMEGGVMNEEFERDVARALDHGDKRMNSLADEITVVKL